MAALGALGLRAVGVDPEEGCVQASARYGEARQGRIEDLPSMLHGESFDVVICSHLLEHLPDPADARRCIGGLSAERYIFAVPNILRPARIVRTSLGRRHGDHPHHLFGWGHAEFERFLKGCGFQVVAWHEDRVTFMPVGGRLGALFGRWLQPLEERWLVKLFPMLSSSLIVSCVRTDGRSSAEGGPSV